MDAELFDDARAHALLDLLLHLLRRGALDLELWIVRLPDKGAVRELLDAEGELEGVVAGVGCHACGILARVRPGGNQGLYASLTLLTRWRRRPTIVGRNSSGGRMRLGVPELL